MDVGRNRDYQVGTSGERLALLVLFILRRRYHPNVSVIVAAELPFGIRTIESRSKQAGRAECSHEVFVVVSVYGKIFLNRPRDIDGAKLHIVGGVKLVVGAALVSDRVELLKALGMDIASQVRQRSLGQHLDVVDAIIHGHRAFEHRTPKRDIALSGNGVGGNIDFRYYFLRSVRNDAAHADAGSEVQIGGRNLGGQIITDQADAIGLRAQLEHGTIGA